MEITQVKEWNRKMRAEGKYILMFTLGNGSMLDEPRKNGYVVGHLNNCRWVSNIDKARELARG